MEQLVTGKGNSEQKLIEMNDALKKDKEDLEKAIEKLAKKYDIQLTDEDKQKLLNLLEKLKGLDLDWDSIKSQAEAWADELQSSGVLDKILAFFQKLIDAIKGFFS